MTSGVGYILHHSLFAVPCVGDGSCRGVWAGDSSENLVASRHWNLEFILHLFATPDVTEHSGASLITDIEHRLIRSDGVALVVAVVMLSHALATLHRFLGLA